MFDQSRQDVIVLCLDIDNTVLNPKTCDFEADKVDFNGEAGEVQNIRYYNTEHNPTQWHQLLDELRSACQAEGVELDLQIISAKVVCDVDCSVDAVVSILHPFFKMLDIKGKPYQQQLTYLLHLPKYYFFAKHQLHGIAIEFTNNVFYTECAIDFPTSGIDALPSIHIVNGNKVVNGFLVNSKAAVMQYIEEQLKRRGKNPLGMIMVDDRDSFEPEVNAYGYEFIHAGTLREATEHHERDTRRIYTTEHLMPRIRNAVNQILSRWRLQKQQMYYMALRSLS